MFRTRPELHLCRNRLPGSPCFGNPVKNSCEPFGVSRWMEMLLTFPVVRSKGIDSDIVLRSDNLWTLKNKHTLFFDQLQIVLETKSIGTCYTRSITWWHDKSSVSCNTFWASKSCGVSKKSYVWGGNNQTVRIKTKPTNNFAVKFTKIVESLVWFHQK